MPVNTRRTIFKKISDQRHHIETTLDGSSSHSVTILTTTMLCFLCRLGFYLKADFHVLVQLWYLKLLRLLQLLDFFQPLQWKKRETSLWQYQSKYLSHEVLWIPILFISRLSMTIWMIVVLNRTVVDSDWHFDNLCSSHLQSQSELYYISWWY